MRKILGAFAALVLGGAAAWAAPDRSALSYDENVVINTTCGAMAKQNNATFQSCVLQQMEALRTHPSPDRTGLSTERTRVIETYCSYLRRKDIGQYNDCVTKMIGTPAAQSQPAATPAEGTSTSAAPSADEVPSS
jgi:hypothetical protein